MESAMSDDDDTENVCEECGEPLEEGTNCGACLEAQGCLCPGGRELGPCSCPYCTREPVERDYDPDVENDRRRDDLYDLDFGRER
jgi:hypothetical protein